MLQFSIFRTGGMSTDLAARGLGQARAELASIEPQLQHFGGYPLACRTNEVEKTDHDRFSTKGHQASDPFITTNA